jgi:hypothetical protein
MFVITKEDLAKARKQVAHQIRMSKFTNLNDRILVVSILSALVGIGWGPAGKTVAPTRERLLTFLVFAMNASERTTNWTSNAPMLNRLADALLASDLFESRAQVQADALREAADFKEAHQLDHDYWTGLADRVYSPGKDMVTEWLRARADGLEAGR